MKRKQFTVILILWMRKLEKNSEKLNELAQGHEATTRDTGDSRPGWSEATTPLPNARGLQTRSIGHMPAPSLQKPRWKTQQHRQVRGQDLKLTQISGFL